MIVLHPAHANTPVGTAVRAIAAMAFVPEEVRYDPHVPQYQNVEKIADDRFVDYEGDLALARACRATYWVKEACVYKINEKALEDFVRLPFNYLDLCEDASDSWKPRFLPL